MSGRKFQSHIFYFSCSQRVYSFAYWNNNNIVFNNYFIWVFEEILRERSMGFRIFEIEEIDIIYTK